MENPNLSIVPKIIQTVPYEDPIEARERDIAIAHGLALKHGFVLVEYDRCKALRANTRTSGFMLARMDAKEREHYEEYRNRQIARHLAEDLLNQGFIEFTTREDHSSPYETDEITTGKLLVVKPKENHDETNATY